MDIASLVRTVPDFPEPGVLFRDITPLLADPAGLAETVDKLAAIGKQHGPVDLVLGMEARGFILAAPVAYSLGAGLVPIRKAGKLPAASYSATYSLEYGTATLEMHQDALAPGAKVLIVDDVLATGGTARATAELVHDAGAEPVAFAFLIELEALGGRKVLGEKLPQIPVETVLTY